jgi:hypothetical protein
MRGIDVPGLDEATRLLRAPAGIGAVHEPAPVIHEAVQVASCASEALTEVLTGDVQELGADHVTDLEDVTQDVGEALLAVETEEHAGGARDSRLIDQQSPSTGSARSSGGSKSGVASSPRP